jgi:hypothetical protein
MSQPKTYEASTIEEALRAVSIDLGDDIEVVSAAKERKGGVFGFFAKERFVVTARSSNEEAVEAADEPEDFGSLLLSLANKVDDTWEPGETDADTSADDTEIALDLDSTEPQPTVDLRAELQARATSVIDLRSGRRTVRPPAPSTEQSTPATTASGPDSGFSFHSERPSQLRQQMRGIERPVEQPAPTILTVAGPIDGLPDTAPAWSLARLEALLLPTVLLETVADFAPESDIEWIHALAIGIHRMLPEEDGEHLSWVIGEGRRSAAELVRGIPAGRIPTAIVVRGHQIDATPDELAFSLRECVQ